MPPQQLSALDAVFLAIETPETPGHIGGLAILDPTTHPEQAFDFGSYVEFVAERLALCPRFSWKLQHVPLGLDQPYWIEEEELDLGRHIRRIALPSPGGTGELCELASYLWESPLDRSRPLWEMFYIEGLQGGRIAMLWKMHHCLLDGASGAGLVELLFDLAPEPADHPLVPVQDDARAGSRRGLLQMAAQGLRNAVKRLPALARHMTRTTAQLARQLRTDGVEGLQSSPASVFNGVVGPKRSVAWSRISLERVKELKNDIGVSVNDVVLGLTGGAVRGYLERRGALPERSLVAGVPVSTRAKGDKSTGNQLSEMGITWSTDIEDPLERVLAIHQATTQAKGSGKANKVNPLEAMAESLIPGAMQLVFRAAAAAADRISFPCNAVVSNVPMSPVPIYMAGARIEGVVPMSLLAPAQGFNISVLSYCGELHFGVIADPDLVDNVWELADAIPKALLRLEEAASADPCVAA